MFIIKEHSDQQQVILYSLSSFFPSPTRVWWLSASFSNMETFLITWMQHFLPLHMDKLLNIQELCAYGGNDNVTWTVISHKH